MKEFKKLGSLVERNIKLYFKDKMIFFVSLITPIILVVLFLTFLGSVYKDTLLNNIPEGVLIGEKMVNAFTGGWLFSSILTTSCITVSFCSNMMVNDKISKSILDFRITPVRKSTLQLSYTISNFITTFIICFTAMIISLLYLAIVGFYLSFVDVLLIFIDMILAISFGSLLASILSLLISSQGAWSALCSLVSSMYGFLCGAYMPLQSCGDGVRAVVSFFPGTYGTILFRQHYMRGVLNEMSEILPNEVIGSIKESFDGTFSFFGHNVPTWAMYLVMIASVMILVGIYLCITTLKIKKIKHLVNFK